MIQFSNVSKVFPGSQRGIKNITCDIFPGDCICLLGPSGSGKTTFLRCLAGFESIDQGRLDKPVSWVVRYVHQDQSLWPHLSILENVTLVPIIKNRIHKDGIIKRAHDLLERFELFHCKHRYPHTLSGGECQRVALIRLMMTNPDVFLLDEITSALDSERVEKVLEHIRHLASLGKTLILSTHNVQFARSIANRLFFFREGELEYEENLKQGQPFALIHNSQQVR